MNPAEVFLIGLSRDTPYFIPIILDYIKPNPRRATGHHFRIPFVKSDGYVAVIDVPVELLSFYLPFQVVTYDGEIVKAEKLGEERELSFRLCKDANVPDKISQFPDVSSYFRRTLKKFFQEEVDRQWVVKVPVGKEVYYFPSTVLGAFFYFLSYKFTTNLFLAGLSREVVSFGKSPPFIQLKPGYSNQYRDVVSLYLYSTNREAKANYDKIGRIHIAKHVYRRKESKFSIRYAFKCSFPVSGEWELRARVVPVEDRSFLVAEILYVNTLKLLGIDFIELRVSSCGKKRRIVLSPSTAVKSGTEKVYDSSSYVNTRESPEVVEFRFSSPPADKSVNIVKRKIEDVNSFSLTIPVPTRVDDEKPLSNIMGFSEEGNAKRVRNKSGERAVRSTESRVFDLETVKKLMNQVAVALGVKMEYKEFVPAMPIKVSGKEQFKLYYPNGKKRKVGVFFFDLPSGKKVTAVFPDQKLQSSFTTSPVIIGSRSLEFPDEVAFFYKMFRELNRENFRRFCRRRGFEVYFKKPLRGSSRKDWENWVNRISGYLVH